jgi:polar amino acid transport system substrate-binding protein
MWQWCVAACLAGLSAGAVAAERPLAVRFSNQAYPPYAGSQLPDGGIFTRVVSEVFRRAHVSVSYVWYPNNRALQLARQGNVDGSLGWTPSSERERDLLFSDEVLPFRMVLFQRQGESYRWKTLADLAPYRFGTTIGNFYSPEFARLAKAGTLQVDESSDDVSNLRKLVARRVDLVPMELETGRYLLRQHLSPAQARLLAAPPRAYWYAPMSMVIWRGHRHAGELMRRFNRELAAMKRSGELARLVADSQRRVFRPRS